MVTMQLHHDWQIRRQSPEEAVRMEHLPRGVGYEDVR